MLNSEKMTFEGPRIQMLDLQVAVAAVIQSFEDEVNNPETTTDRREICKSAIARRWRPLYQMLDAQFEKQDAALLKKYNL